LSRKARSEVKEQKRLITGFLVLILPVLLIWKISPASPRRTEAQGMPAPTGTPLPPLAAESLAYVPETAWHFPDYPRNTVPGLSTPASTGRLTLALTIW
jgi:hypothetical protein